MSQERGQRAKLKLIDNIDNAKKEQKTFFEDIAYMVESINPQLGGFEELASLLSMPEETFNKIAPFFLDELQKSFNNTNDKLIITQTLNAQGLKLEDVEKSYKDLCEQIDTKMDKTLSRSKRNFLKSMISLTYNAISDTEGIAKKTILIPCKLCHEDAKFPVYAHTGDAGMDLYALEDITIHPGETKLVKTGIKVAIPYGYALLVHPRSGLSLKSKMRVGNSIGLIDAPYRGEIGVIIDNIEPSIKDINYHFDDDGHPVIDSILHGADMHIGKGERFAQLRLVEVPKAAFYEVDSVADIGEDRNGGFGSTGVK